MKKLEKNLAKTMRLRGLSMKTIAKQLKVSTGTVSRWVGKIELSSQQKAVLKKNGFTTAAIEKRRATRLAKENHRRQIIIDKAQNEIKNISAKTLFFIGISLYWAEGSKTRRNIVEFSNGDPRLIKIMMRFFKQICKVPNDKFRGHIHLHPHLNRKQSEQYWNKISGIPLEQFFKTSQQKNKASQNKKDSLPFGTFSIYICNTELFLKIKGWMEGLSNRLK